VRGEPDVGKEFIELIRGMGRQATEDILQVREGIDVEVLGWALPTDATRLVGGAHPTSDRNLCIAQ
jgi:hypothetical protein